MGEVVALNEVLRLLSKILGRLPKSEFSSYDKPLDVIIDYLAPPDHTFIPYITVTDAGASIAVNGFLWSIKVDSSSAPVKYNLDRPVTDTEYDVVYPGVELTIARKASTIYLKAPAGQVSKVMLRVLRGLA